MPTGLNLRSRLTPPANAYCAKLEASDSLRPVDTPDHALPDVSTVERLQSSCHDILSSARTYFFPSRGNVTPAVALELIASQATQTGEERTLMDIGISRVSRSVWGILFVMSALVACQSGDDAHNALEESNLKKAVYCMELLEIEFDVETADRECFGESYVQHAPHVPDGRDAVISFFTARVEKYPESSIEIKRAAADGDLVWIHLHSKRTPDALGSAIIHIFRMEDGRFVEHWGVSQPVPEESAHDNTMF